MHLSIFLCLWASTTLALYRLIHHLVTKHRRATKARQWKCKPAPMFNRRDPLGIRHMRDLIRAADEGHILDYAVKRHDILSKREGRQITTMRNILLGSEMLFTAEPKNIQAMLAVQFKDFELGEARIGNLRPLLGTGIFASDGTQWEHSRALLRPQFARDQISDLNLEERHVQNLMKVLLVHDDGWTGITDIQPLLFRLTLDSATEFLFGESADSQLHALPGHLPTKNAPPECDERVFASAFDRVQGHLARGFQLGNRYWMAHNRDFKQQCGYIHAFVDHFVDVALSKAEHTDQKTSLPSTTKYIFLDELALRTQDPAELRAQLLNILVAGRDTTAALLTWLFLMLAKHPSIYAKLRCAVIEEFGEYALDSQAGNITFPRLKGCTYLQHTLNECLRLYPVVSWNARRARVDTTIPLGGGVDGTDPVFVPAGRSVEYSVHVMHRRKDLWGDDAEDFRPERWQGRKTGWEYLPFNGGPRICIGQQFALTEASYVTVRLLQRFDRLEGIGLEGEVKHALTLTNIPAGGVKVRFREACVAEE